MIRLLVVAVLLFAALPAQAQFWIAQTEWVGRYPFDKIKGRTLFASKPLSATLRGRLGAARAAFIQGLAVELPVAQVGDLLVVQKCRAHACPDANMAILMDVVRGDFDVCLWRPFPKGRFERRWYLTGSDKPIIERVDADTNVPNCFQGAPKDLIAVRDALLR